MLLYTEEPTVDHKALRSRRHERLLLRQTISMMQYGMRNVSNTADSTKLCRAPSTSSIPVRQTYSAWSTRS